MTLSLTGSEPETYSKSPDTTTPLEAVTKPLSEAEMRINIDKHANREGDSSYPEILQIQTLIDSTGFYSTKVLNLVRTIDKSDPGLMSEFSKLLSQYRQSKRLAAEQLALAADMIFSEEEGVFMTEKDYAEVPYKFKMDLTQKIKRNIAESHDYLVGREGMKSEVNANYLSWTIIEIMANYIQEKVNTTSDIHQLLQFVVFNTNFILRAIAHGEEIYTSVNLYQFQFEKYFGYKENEMSYMLEEIFTCLGMMFAIRTRPMDKNSTVPSNERKAFHTTLEIEKLKTQLRQKYPFLNTAKSLDGMTSQGPNAQARGEYPLAEIDAPIPAFINDFPTN